MIKNIYIATLCAVCLSLVSCNDWLDVRQDKEQKDEDLFSKESGFRSALTGCYMDLADQDAYGENLTMTYTEALANLWQMPDPSKSSYDTYKTSFYLRTFQYDSDESKAAMKAIYAKLFNIITQANMIINHANSNKSVFESEKNYNIITGEAYALRALCQMDVLRLFGQLPQNATKQVSLPYSETATIETMPPYYSFSDYVAKLKSDLSTAESMLKDNDPVYGTTFDKASDDDDYFDYRQFRLNYWAVKALQARLALYLGDTETANSTAMEIINAQPLELSGLYDLATEYSYPTCPSEALFMLSKYDLLDYTVTLFTTGLSGASGALGNYYLITPDQYTQLYLNVETSSHNRYHSWWKTGITNTQSATGNVALTKYTYDSKNLNTHQSDALITKMQVIPMIRLSEIYLIAIETSNDLSEVNSLYNTYMRSHNVLVENAFSTLDEARSEVINEYRREFFGEGIMFYTYKRKGAKTQMFCDSEVTEDNYIIPLPTTEYDPSAVKK